MRILHTSDWHLGRQFHGQGMLGHQAAFVDHLIATVTERAVDLVVVAGDIYDRALPPVDAVALADDAFARLAATGARVVLTSGNHDSARRLGFNARLADAAGFHLRTDIDQVGVPVLIEDAHGTVAVYGIPYLEPDQVKRAWDLRARSHEAALTEAMERIRTDLAARGPGTRSVVLAHAFVVGGAASESERDIAVGGVAAVPTAVFDGIDYVALGHLHGQHTLTESIRYSGSPLAYSFSEAGHRKGCWLIDLHDSGLTAEFVEAPVPRRLVRLAGTIEGLLADASHAGAEDAWVQVTLTDPVRPARAMARLQARFPHLVALHFTPPPGTERSTSRPVEGRSDHEIALAFVADVRGEPASAVESDLLRDACEASAADPDADVVVVA
ncbi:MAG: exonuclease SbcCD subunit D [Marmoricola sp.]